MHIRRIVMQHLMRFTLAAISFATLAQMAQLAQAAGGRGGFNAPRLDYEIIATGLVPVFPVGQTCPGVASGWGSPERFDGSTRVQGRNSGLHGGMDISLREGTPLLAIAAGTVLATGEGGALEGIYLWLEHLPSDTGLAYRGVTKYQHLAELPSLKPGERVTLGQVVGRSGLTGTRGPAFGPAGYPHLHMSFFVMPSVGNTEEPKALTRVPPRDGKLSDPLLLFLAPDITPDNVATLPDTAKRVPVAVMNGSSQLTPPGAKVVWPVTCFGNQSN
jgi:murein DD-endopeptidase MepM/ murein hydrolase activator NlpD